MHHPELTMMIAASKRIVRDARPQPPRTDHPGPLTTVRARMGNALIALGTRIAPPSQPATMRLPRPRPATGA